MKPLEPSMSPTFQIPAHSSPVLFSQVLQLYVPLIFGVSLIGPFQILFFLIGFPSFGCETKSLEKGMLPKNSYF